MKYSILYAEDMPHYGTAETEADTKDTRLTTLPLPRIETSFQGSSPISRRLGTSSSDSSAPWIVTGAINHVSSRRLGSNREKPSQFAH